MKSDDDENHKLRAHLVVKGYVQGVGYRNTVMRIARQMDVLGLTRNLDNGDVEIFCKCKNSKHLNGFIERIKIKSDHEDLYSPNVEKIEKNTNQKEIDDLDPPNKFVFFNIDYKDAPDYGKEMLIKIDTGSKIMLGAKKETEKTAVNVEDMHNDMNQCFGTLDRKYDSIGQELKSVHEDLKLVSVCFKELVQYVTKKDTAKKK